MAYDRETFTLGVEEEYQIIDPDTRELSSSSASLLPRAQHTLGENAQQELQLSQVEAVSSICHTLHDVRTELVRLRRDMAGAATQQGKQIAAAGTHPFSHWKKQRITPKDRYQGIVDDYQQIAREPIFGCHVHVGLRDREIALHVMNQARLWLAPLLALTANSPFWLGEDTGYASFRTLMWSRWPPSGPPQHFKSLQEYYDLVQAMVATGSIEDATKIYWDIRLSERFKTIEFRIADSCMTINETIMLAGFIRALVRTCYERVMREEPLPNVRPELMRAAHWRAARYGLSRELIDIVAQRTIPADAMVEKLLAFSRAALEAEGDWDEISALVRETLQHGNGAVRQRAIYQRTTKVEDVVDFMVTETMKGTS